MPRTPKPQALGSSVYDLRRENLALLLDGPGRKTQLAVRMGFSQARVSHLLKEPGTLGSRRITTDQARELEQVLGIPQGALDYDPAQPATPSKAGEAHTQLMRAVVRALTTATSDLGVNLDPEVTSELAGVVYDQSEPGKPMPLPQVKQLVKLAALASRK